MRTIQLKDLPDDAIVQMLCNGDYDGIDREIGGPITKAEFMQQLLWIYEGEDEQPTPDWVDFHFREWELPDGACTNHLLTIHNASIARVICS